jgi:hypothetical protein
MARTTQKSSKILLVSA